MFDTNNLRSDSDSGPVQTNQAQNLLLKSTGIMRRRQDKENGEGHQEREKLGQEKVEEDKKEEGWIPLDKEH